jgi:tRNA threonylcarbamoyladenosine biosynthesis protein TsaE
MITSHSVAETMDFGRQLAASLQPRDVVAMTGDLGAGKTCLVKGIAAGLGVTQVVTSPTFTLIHEYRDGRLPVYHVDLYRLDSVRQAQAIGLEEYLGGDGVTIIEWAEKITELLPANARWINMKVAGETTRQIEFT